MDSNNFSVRDYLSLIGKDSVIHIMFLQFMWRKDFFLHVTWPLKILQILTYVFKWLYFIQCLPSFSFTVHCLCFCARFFVTVSSSIGKVFFISPSATVFAFGDFNIHHKGWLTYFGGTSEVKHSIFISNGFAQVVNFSSQISTVTIGFMSIFWRKYFLCSGHPSIRSFR